MLRTADQAFRDLEALPGLGSVTSEIKALVAGLETGREQRPPHLIFTGPAGVGKTLVAHALSDIYRSRGVMRKANLLIVDRSSLVSGFIGQTSIRTLEICRNALDGILMIDDADILSPASSKLDFGREAIEALATFMDDHGDRLGVIVSGYPAEMQRFLAEHPAFASRFTTTIDFPAISTSELCDIFQMMAAQQKLALPQGFESTLTSWIESRRGGPHWGNARSMRSLLDRAHEAHARRTKNPGADIIVLMMADIEAAIGFGINSFCT